MAGSPICAIATPAGTSAIGVVRLSGAGCLRLLEPFFHRKTRGSLYENARKALFGTIQSEAGDVIDEVIVIAFAGSASYTGEDSAEIHCHGSPLVLQKIISLLLESGFSMARPGEFTQRAFLNQKIDLTQAEATRNIIEARSERELQHAYNLKRGSFRTDLLQFRSSLMNLLADLSAELDFIDEDITFETKDTKLQLLANLYQACTTLVEKVKTAELFKAGFSVAIAGPANAGKSSLLNYLAGQERAIVSDTPGTTRDYIEISLQLNGARVNFIDTAGLRKLENMNDHAKIEQEGIKRSTQKSREADMVLLVHDGAQEFKADYSENFTGLKVLHAINKADLLHRTWQKEKAELAKMLQTRPEDIFVISVKEQQNLDHLSKAIVNQLENKAPQNEGILLSSWQADLLQKMSQELATAKRLLEEDELPEIIVASIQQSLDFIAQITGDISTEEILGRIFSRFCIGK